MKLLSKNTRFGSCLRWAACMLAVALPLAASSGVSFNFAELSQRAQSVIGGRITKVVSETDPASGYIYSTVTVAVSDAVPAQHAGREYSFRMVGGESGGQSLYISDFPRLETDESVVLFLQSNTSTVFGPTVGLWQGVFFVEDGAANGKQTVTDSQRRPVLGVSDRQLVRGFSRASRGEVQGVAAEGAPEGLDLQEFFNQVRLHRGTAGQ